MLSALETGGMEPVAAVIGESTAITGDKGIDPAKKAHQYFQERQTLKSSTPLDLPERFMSPRMCSCCHREDMTRGVHLQHPSDCVGRVWAAGISSAWAPRQQRARSPCQVSPHLPVPSISMQLRAAGLSLPHQPMGPGRREVGTKCELSPEFLCHGTF